MATDERLERERVLRGIIPRHEIEQREAELRASSEPERAALIAAAKEAFGEHALESLEPALTRTGKALWMVSQHRPAPEDVPGFFW